MLKIRRSRDRLIFNTGIPILVRRHIYIDTAPRSQGRGTMMRIFDGKKAHYMLAIWIYHISQWHLKYNFWINIKQMKYNTLHIYFLLLTWFLGIALNHLSRIYFEKCLYYGNKATRPSIWSKWLVRYSLIDVIHGDIRKWRHTAVLVTMVSKISKKYWEV